MKATSHSRWKFERKPSAEPSFHWRWLRQRGMRARAHFSVLASASQPHGAQRISEDFSPRFGQCKDLLPENAFSQGFCRILRVQFCSSLAQNTRNFLAESFIDDEK
jgi:hypothetical protein